MCALVTGVQTCALPICTIRTAGWPAALAVASAIALGSLDSVSLASASQTSNNTSGSSVISASAHPLSGQSGEYGAGRATAAKKPAKNQWREENPARSEEHTSELQSLMRNSHAVFCLKK